MLSASRIASSQYHLQHTCTKHESHDRINNEMKCHWKAVGNQMGACQSYRRMAAIFHIKVVLIFYSYLCGGKNQWRMLAVLQLHWNKKEVEVAWSVAPCIQSVWAYPMWIKENTSWWRCKCTGRFCRFIVIRMQSDDMWSGLMQKTAAAKYR